MPTFILNDESKLNSYGFRTKNAGIDLERFKANPVMLDSHFGGSTSSVIGKWTNIRIEGQLLKADTEFDMEDESAKKIAGKVERGFLKGVSMGLSFNRSFMVALSDGTFELEKSELLEASIVSIPSNANAIKLYAETGELIPEEEIKLSLQNLPSNFKNPNMLKLNLSLMTLVALGLQNADDGVALSSAIEKLVSDHKALGTQLDAEKVARQAVEAKLQAIADKEATALVDQAVTDGRITADKKEHFLSLAKTNFESAKGILEAIPAKASLAGATVIPATGEFANVKTEDDFQKLTEAQQLSFRNDCPDAYAKLFS
jgi:hypothetical protein